MAFFALAWLPPCSTQEYPSLADRKKVLSKVLRLRLTQRTAGGFAANRFEKTGAGFIGAQL